MLVATARGLRAEIPAGQPAVLMLHWSISGAATPTGVMTDDFREVVLDLDALMGLGFDAIVAGHIHKPQELDVGIFYVGSPAPVDFGEGASEHGCYLLDFDGGCLTTTFVPIESRPFVTLDYDPERDVFNGPPVFDVDRPYEDGVIRVRYTATEEQARRVDHSVITRALYDAGAHKVFAIQPTIEREDRVRVAGVDEELAPLSALDLWLEAEGLDGWERDSLQQLTSRYLEAVGV